jgi:hypothetical protein
MFKRSNCDFKLKCVADFRLWILSWEFCENLVKYIDNFKMFTRTWFTVIEYKFDFFFKFCVNLFSAYKCIWFVTFPCQVLEVLEKIEIYDIYEVN